ncbi:MAG: hypothetical protein PHI37_02060 [Candidatus Gracilibacteria bacterium]|nr:hypothetical protein [Candidatus Gracilibacteria bacterium]
MRTSIETKIKDASQFEARNLNSDKINGVRNGVTIDLIHIMDEEFNDKKQALIELEIARLLGLGGKQKRKLMENYGEKFFTLDSAMTQAEQYWESANDSRYEIAA